MPSPTDPRGNINLSIRRMSARTRSTEKSQEAGRAAARAKGHHIWSDVEDAELLRLRQVSHANYDEIGRILRLMPSVCESRYRNLCMARNASLSLLGKGARSIPEEVLIDRDRRYAARETQSIGGRTFGDPPPGFNALDRKRASA